ncbi:MAG: hypothetical protein ETSY1_42865 [Candidatus Entotheonella factor]|uniref:Uncharacterized protein n=1 Tax=Entotheonella factor TaxID=1429438 RepID=W4L3D8_ENTF1|nr:MAG: hypothetical protein ETSY1_42865 [Candidatus Entotheonella factor]
MSRPKDLKSKPKHGTFFPIRFSDLIRFVKETDLNDCFGNRIAIRLENRERTSEFGIPLADLVPEEELALYSVPEHISESAAKNAVIIACEELCMIQSRKNNFNSTKYSYFCAYLNENGTITITRKDVSVQRPKYRGTQKFSNAFGTKKRKVSETVLVTKIPNKGMESDALKRAPHETR